jgi:hypothetical protein
MRIRNRYYSIRGFLSEVIKYKLKNYRIFNQAISRINYFASVLDLEYDLVKNDRYFNAKKVYFGYISKKSIDIPIPDLEHKATGIVQIGHSGNPYLNHVYIMRQLHQKGIQVNKIISPLSYSCSLEYRDWVMMHGNKYFGNKFNPLVEFIPLGKYMELMDSVNILIIGAERQIALGNITSALAVGIKVFLPKSSVLYSYFKNEGVKIYSIEDDLTQKEIDTHMSLDDAVRNQSWAVARRKLFTNRIEQIRSSIMRIAANEY